MASSIWPWGGGYRPQMVPLTQRFHDQVRSGAVITAVDLIRGIGHYAGLRVINVPGATGLYDTNFEGKAQAAIDALLGTDPAAPTGGDDFVYLHVEASDEAGHDGSIPLKLQTIEDLDHRLIQPILRAFYGITFPSSPSSPLSPSPSSSSPSCPSPSPPLSWVPRVFARKSPSPSPSFPTIPLPASTAPTLPTPSPSASTTPASPPMPCRPSMKMPVVPAPTASSKAMSL